MKQSDCKCSGKYNIRCSSDLCASNRRACVAITKNDLIQDFIKNNLNVADGDKTQLNL